MAAREEALLLTINLKSFKDVSKLAKAKLKHSCKNLVVDTENRFGEKALANVVCNSLSMSTSSTASRTDTKNLVDEVQNIFTWKIPLVMETGKEVAIYPAANGRGSC